MPSPGWVRLSPRCRKMARNNRERSPSTGGGSAAQNNAPGILTVNTATAPRFGITEVGRFASPSVIGPRLGSRRAVPPDYARWS